MAARGSVDLLVGALVSAAAVTYVVADSAALSNAVYLGPMIFAAVAAWVAAVRTSGARRSTTMLLAAGITLTALGDTTWVVLDALGPVGYVTIADVAWYASYLALAVAMVWMVRASGAARNWDFVLDAATIGVVSLLVLWTMAVETVLANPAFTHVDKVALAAYPVCDALLLALVVRILTSRATRAALHPVFAVGILVWLGADLTYLYDLNGTAVVITDVAWMVAPVMMARGLWALRTDREAGDLHEVGRVAQIAIAVAPLMLPSLLEVVNDARGHEEQPWVLLAGSVSLAVLALLRMVRMARAEARLRAELVGARDDALAASRAKSHFLATMTHEFRTPLTTVLCAGEILQETMLDEEQVNLVRRVRRAGYSLNALVDEVLDFSQIDTGQVEPVLAPFDLRWLVEDLAAAGGPRADASRIGISSTWDPAVPALVTGDQGLLSQVLGQLVDNAFKFTSEGEVRIEVRLAEGEDVGAGMVDIVVTDTGVGIPADKVSLIFEPFRQADESETRRFGGVGLGLAICHELTELMGGTIHVFSEEGIGSRFVVRLPLVTAEAVWETRVEAAPARGTGDLELASS